MEKSRPFISVIIPTYERAGQLSVCLGAFATQDYPQDRFEVLVVDDGSAAVAEVGVVASHRRFNVRFLRQPHAGPAAARNYGAAQAKGSFLAFTDDDCVPAPSWLKSLATSFISFPDCVVGGRTVNGLADNPYATASQLMLDYLYAHWNADPEHATFFASNNFGLPVHCFQAVGGFDVGWTRAAGEDRDLCDRLIARGYRLITVPDALVSHEHPLTWQGFWRQQFNYGHSAYRLYRIRARRDPGRVPFERLAYYLKMLLYPFTRTSRGNALMLAGLLVIAQAAHVVGFLWESTKRRV